MFTRFITPERAEDATGRWRAYYERWRPATREHLDPRLLDLMPPLASLVPPAQVFDKPVYSAFAGHRLHQHLQERAADALLVTGSETDVCVLATVLGAVDLGYRVILVTDAVCSSSDQGHDNLLEVYSSRFSVQVETADSETILGELAGLTADRPIGLARGGCRFDTPRGPSSILARFGKHPSRPRASHEYRT